MLFNEIIGQEKVKEKLISTVKDGRISHAQIFLGNEGSGNLAIALAYAQYVSCSNRKEKDSCGQCPSCKKYQKLIHPDLHFVFPVVRNKNFKKPVSNDFLKEWREITIENPYFSAKNWHKKIDANNLKPTIYTSESNEIIKKLNLKTFEADYKVMIIWQIETMNVAGANKLLKILEEPPEKTLFLLISENSERILKTILSRTQLIKVPKIEKLDIEKKLKETFDFEKEEIDDIIHLSNGNYQKALELIENKEDNKILLDLFTNLMRFSYSKKIIEITEWVNEIAKIGREKQKQFLDYALRLIRENFILNIAKEEKKLIFLTKEEKNFSERFCTFININNVFAINKEFNLAHFHISSNANNKIVFLDLAIKLMNLLKIK